MGSRVSTVLYGAFGVFRDRSCDSWSLGFRAQGSELGFRVDLGVNFCGAHLTDPTWRPNPLPVVIAEQSFNFAT